MKTHAPGPWEVSPRCGCFAVVDANKKEIVFVDGYPRFFEGKPCGSVTSQGRTRDELAANARLIAAAPDLLACVEMVFSAAEDGGDMNDIDWDKLRAAIKKAGGEA